MSTQKCLVNVVRKYCLKKFDNTFKIDFVDFKPLFKIMAYW